MSATNESIPGVTLPSRPRPRGVPRRWLIHPVILSALLTVAVWELVSLLAGTNTVGQPMVPGIPDVVRAFTKLADYWKGGLGVPAVAAGGKESFETALLGFSYNTGLTALHLICGLVLGIGAGMLLALLVSWSRTVRQLLTLPSHFARMMPLLAMVPLFSLWFGDTMQGAILFIAFTSFVLVFPIALNAIGNVPRYYAQYAHSLGASRLRTYLEVVVPAALPEVRSAIMLAVGFGWSAAIAAEYLGQDYGLGRITQNAQYFGRTNVLALVGVIALVLAAISYGLARWLLAWVTRWAE